MLYLIGLGLGDPSDITVKGLDIVKKAHKVYLENYTSILSCTLDNLEKFYGREVICLDRDMMEQGCQELLEECKQGDVAVLVVGDPLNATTHTDLILRALNLKVPYKIIHNASIVSAIACCGLQIYRFGEIVSIPFWTNTWKPESFFDKILSNRNNNLHTLCLLDIKVKEPNLELLTKGITRFDPPSFMSVSQAACQLVEIIRKRDSETTQGLTKDTVCICLARVGCHDQHIVKTSLKDATDIDIGEPLHSIVIPSEMHPIEEEFLEQFK